MLFLKAFKTLLITIEKNRIIKEVISVSELSVVI
jgi:hypothetical protein